MKYFIPPKEIFYDQIRNKHKLSGLAYFSVIKSKSSIPIKNLVEEPVKGIEVGEKSYVECSDFYFIKNRSIRRYNYIPTGHTSFLSKGGVSGIVPIKPSSFENLDLQKNDILYTKDTTLGECAIIESNNYDKHVFSSGLLKLRSKNNLYYIFGFLKHEYLRDQINAMTIKGSILSHSGDNVLSCEIPFPNDKSQIKKVESFVKDLIIIDLTIKKNHLNVVNIIENELNDNQKKSFFNYSFPTFGEIKKHKRLDAALYDKSYKNFIFKLKNYKNGTSTIKEMGFKVKRGQNLQISAIGVSVYSKYFRKNYYRLIRPRDVSPYGTVDKIEYLGNKAELDLLNDGDVMFGSEGTYRPTVFYDLKNEKTITNIHGMIIYRDPPSYEDSAFICAYIWFLAQQGILAILSVGAHGGSVTKDYVLDLPIPNFPKSVKDKILDYYSSKNPQLEKLGISQLDLKKLSLAEQLDVQLDDIIFNRV